jgi:peptidyl-prolyl cis-trans isomerase C
VTSPPSTATKTSAPRQALDWGRAHPVLPDGRRPRLVGIVLLAVLALGSAAAGILVPGLPLPAGAAVRVGGAIVTDQQLDQWTKMMTVLTGQPAPPNKADIAKTLAINTVTGQAAQQRNIVISDKTANDKLTELLEKSFPQGRDEFVAALAKVGVPQTEVVSEVKSQLEKAQLFGQLTGSVPPPTDQQVARYYTAHQAALVVPPKRHIRNIVVSSQAAAAQVLARLQHGEDFATVAQQTSIDPETKNNGGDLGTASRDEIQDKAFGDAAFAAAPNSLFGPVQSNPNVWSVGQVLEVTPQSQLSLDQARDWLRAELYQSNKLRVFGDWISQQLKRGHVKYADGYQPADPTGPPPVPDFPMQDDPQ